MAPHSSTLAWKIPWIEEPGRLPSMGSRRVKHDWATSLSLFTFHFHALEKEMATHSCVLAWRIPGMGEPGGLPSMGLHRVGHDWNDLAAAAAAVDSLLTVKSAVNSCLIPGLCQRLTSALCSVSPSKTCCWASLPWTPSPRTTGAGLSPSLPSASKSPLLSTAYLQQGFTTSEASCSPITNKRGLKTSLQAQALQGELRWDSICPLWAAAGQRLQPWVRSLDTSGTQGGTEGSRHPNRTSRKDLWSERSHLGKGCRNGARIHYKGKGHRAGLGPALDKVPGPSWRLPQAVVQWFSGCHFPSGPRGL